MSISIYYDIYRFSRVSGHRHLCLSRGRHYHATLSAKKFFPRRSSIKLRVIPGFRLSLDVAFKCQTRDVAPVKAIALCAHFRSA
jgi:hypothetical protein